MELESYHSKHHDSNISAHSFTNAYNDLRVFIIHVQIYLRITYPIFMTNCWHSPHYERISICSYVLQIVSWKLGIECFKIC